MEAVQQQHRAEAAGGVRGWRPTRAARRAATAVVHTGSRLQYLQYLNPPVLLCALQAAALLLLLAAAAASVYAAPYEVGSCSPSQAAAGYLARADSLPIFLEYDKEGDSQSTTFLLKVGAGQGSVARVGAWRRLLARRRALRRRAGRGAVAPGAACGMCA